MSPAPIARFSFVAAVTGILFAGAFVVTLVGAGGGCSVNTAGITDPGSGLDGIGGSGSESRGGVGGNISILTGTGGAVSTGAGGARDGTGGSGDGNGNGGATGAGGAISGSGGATDGMGGAHEGAGGMQAGTGGTNDGTGGTGMGGAPGMGGRGMGGTPGMGGAGMGGMPGMGGAPGTGGMISVIGCADGTREAFVNVNTFPSIAGCDGAWSVAGVVSTASMTPSCNRAAGNTGTLRNGTGCSVADLCAVGWHVCGGASELAALNVTCAQAGLPNGNGTAAQVLYATRQRGVIGTTCNANDMLNIDTNDVHGCGNTGLAEDRNCAPLNAQFSHTECDDLGPPWSCPGTLTEGLTVVKSSSANGGVLCCK